MSIESCWLMIFLQSVGFCVDTSPSRMLTAWMLSLLSSPRDSVQFFFQSIFLLLFRIQMILLLPFQCRCFLFLFGRGGSNFSGWDIQYMSYQEIKEYSYEGLNKPGNSERLVEPRNQVSLQRLMNVSIILLPCGELMKEISLGF